MKKSFAVLLMLALALVVSARRGAAAPASYSTYSATSTNAGTLAHAIVGANSISGGAPVVTSIDAVSDKTTTPKVQFYRVTAEVPCSHTNSTVTLFMSTTNGFGGSGTIVIRHLLTDTYEKRTLTANTGATNLVVTAAPLEAVLPGDILYKVAAAGYLQFRTNTYTVANSGWSVLQSGTALYAGDRGKPLLLEADATTTGNINQVTARFDP